MDRNFQFPRPQPAAPRPVLPSTGAAPTASRESNALRESVLDAALELGLSARGGISDWMFDNPLHEEDENVPSASPSPTRPAVSDASYSHSSNTHDDSSLIYQTSDASSTSQVHVSFQNPHTGSFQNAERNNKPPADMAGVMGLGIGAMLPGIGSGIANSNAHRPLLPPTAKLNISKNKLRKKRANGDGYESDGGYVSDVAAKHKDRSKKEEKLREKERLKEEKAEKRARKSDATSGSGIASADKDSGYATSYETDSNTPAKKSKSKKTTKVARTHGEGGYETDDGYQSSASVKKKSRFFRLMSSSSKPDLKNGDGGGAETDTERYVIPPVPAMPPMPLPIAQRFATTPTPSFTSSSASVSSFDTESHKPSSSEDGRRANAVRFVSMAQSEGGTTYEHKYDSSYSTITPSMSESTFDRTPTPTANLTLSSPPAKPVISYPITRSTSPVPPSLFVTPLTSPPPQSPRSPKDRHIPSPLSIPTLNYQTNPNQSHGWASNSSPSGSPYVMVTPSTDYIVPSPANSPLFSPPNVLAHHDIPPPSPPPTGPLPKPPPISSSSSSGPPSPVWINRSIRPSESPSSSGTSTRRPSFAPHDNTTVNRNRNSNSDSDSSLFVKPSSATRAAPIPTLTSPSSSVPPVQRGRSSPFPVRPVHRNPSINVTPVVSGTLESRVKVPRYRELYALPSPAGGWPGEQTSKARNSIVPGITVVEPDGDDRYGGRAYGIRPADPFGAYNSADDDDDNDGDALHGVLDRYEYSDDGTVSSSPNSAALPRSRSFDQSLQTPASYDDSDLLGGGSRKSTASRWSGSQYSRVSVLDPDRSREARGQFVEHVRKMSIEEEEERETVRVAPLSLPRKGSATGPLPVKGRGRPIPF